MYLKHLTLGLFAVLICSITACKKKDDAEPALPIIGTWQPAEPDETLKYMEISSDGYQYMLLGTALNLRVKQGFPYTATAEQIYLTGGYFSNGGNFNYEVSNDTLYVESGNFTRVMLRVTNGPDKDNWQKEATISTKYALPFIGNIGALDWDGSQFLISSFYTKRLYKYDPVAQMISDSSTITYRTGGFCYHLGNVWVNNYQNDEQLYQIDFASGLASFGSVSNTVPVIALASDGNKIWGFGGGDQNLYSYNVAADAFTVEGTLIAPILGTSGLGSFNGDMVIKDGYAYIVFGSYIGKFSLSTLQFVDTYFVKGLLVGGIAYDGTDFWVNGYTDGSNLLNSEGIFIAKINLQ